MSATDDAIAELHGLVRQTPARRQASADRTAVRHYGSGTVPIPLSSFKLFDKRFYRMLREDPSVPKQHGCANFRVSKHVTIGSLTTYRQTIDSWFTLVREEAVCVAQVKT